MTNIISKTPTVKNINGLQGENTLRSSLLGLLAIILGGCIAVAFLSVKYTGKKTDFEDAATFGAATTSVMASVDGRLIHCSDSRDANKCISGAKDRHAVMSVVIGLNFVFLRPISQFIYFQF